MEYTWKLTDQEITELDAKGGDKHEAQEAKKQAYREAGGIILNPDALEDMYEALRMWADDEFFSQIEFANVVCKVLAKAEDK